jgi:precorrin-2 dehydrogenase/sirohydrochlorin ferrochelatase
MFDPVFLNLDGKRVVVIGGGEVAERKVLPLVDCGADVTVISPEVTPRLDSMAASNVIALERRRYEAGDCAGAFLVISATDDPDLHRVIWEDAQQAGAIVNTVDDPALCDFIAPAVINRGDLTVAISTNSRSPGLAAYLRRRLLRLIGPEYGELLNLLAEIRPEIRQRVSDVERRKEIHYRIIESGVVHLLRNGDRAGAQLLIRRTIDEYVQQELPTR